MDLLSQITNATRQAMRVENGPPLVMTFGAATGPCFQGDVAKTKELEGGGFMADYDVSYYVINTDWTTVPAQGDKVTVNSVSYRVESTVTSVNDPVTQLLCKGIDA